MTVRERTQMLEEQILSSEAALSSKTIGRDRPEEESDLRTPFQRDRDDLAWPRPRSYSVRPRWRARIGPDFPWRVPPL